MVDPTVELEATKAALQALQPLDQEQAARALRWLAEILGVSASVAGASAPSSVLVPGISTPSYQPAAGQPALAPTGGPPMSPEEFLAFKRPKNGAEKIACLGFYLSEYRGTHHFKTPDIVAINTEAAQSKFGNPNRDVDNADRSSGYLASAGGGTRQVSARGKALVRAMPDREAVQAALKDHPVRRRKSTSKRTGASDDGSPATTTSTVPRKTTKRTAAPAKKLAKP